MGDLRRNPGRGRGVFGGKPIKGQDTGKHFGRGKPRAPKPLRPWGR